MVQKSLVVWFKVHPLTPKPILGAHLCQPSFKIFTELCSICFPFIVILKTSLDIFKNDMYKLPDGTKNNDNLMNIEISATISNTTNM